MTTTTTTTVNDIRSTFLSWFGARDHEIVHSASLVPTNDPSLMFTAAGMVPFKNLFTGLEKRDYVRAVTSQKCVRAGGKHNDLDNVGYTSRHHTFFEMLGNFSFGDYSKDIAIEHAWNLITKEFGLSPERLLVTIYHDDDEAYNHWHRISGFGDDKILRINSKDNFWEMGDVGPCGPCSEIFFDHGDKIAGGPPGSADEDGDRFVEIWNLVFMQYEKTQDGKQIDLPKPSIDTGMGLERIAAVLSGSHDNYDIDLFRNLISASESLLGVESNDETRASHRVIADHLRAMCFLIADGVLPSNEGRGYVLRRIMRRAMRHANLLGSTEPLLWKLTSSLIKEMGEAYPELSRHQTLLEETLRSEETRFQRTLSKGLELLDTASAGLKSGDTFAGDVAFKLYDTYGFPLDLTQDALRRREIEVDIPAFDTAMQKQKEAARASWKGADGKGTGSDEFQSLWFSLSEELGPTEFLGYTLEESQGMVLALVDSTGARIESASGDDTIYIVLNQTPFYAESGGQQGDTGKFTADGIELEITDTQKRGVGLFVHEAKVISGEVKQGDGLTLTIDSARRQGLRSHHSATHLLHEALREVLGSHVSQKGSLVTPTRLRFDFAHNKSVSPEERENIFSLINTYVRQNSPVSTTLMAVDDAIALGAQAQFGEKYGEEVRVVAMGYKDTNETPWSLELCGGTHVSRTGDIDQVVFVAESAVGSGIRRIEASTGESAKNYLSDQQDQLQEKFKILQDKNNKLKEDLKITVSKSKIPDSLSTADAVQLKEWIEILEEENKKLQKDLDSQEKSKVIEKYSKGIEPEKINGINFKSQIINNVSATELKMLCTVHLNLPDCDIITLGTKSSDGKATIVVATSDSLTETYHAGNMVRKAAEVLGGKGGGRPDMAQAGGPESQNLEKALQAVKSLI